MNTDLVIGMAGSGGDGIVSAGESLTAAATVAGYHVMMTKSFGSQIRGGESSCRVRLATRPIFNPGGTLDVAVALNWDDFMKFGAELPVGGKTVVIYDALTGIAPDQVPLVGVSPSEVLSVPIAEIAKRTSGSDRAKNIVVLGLLAGWFGIAQDALLKGIHKRFAKKSAAVLEGAERAFRAGTEYANEHPLREPRVMARPEAVGGNKLLTDGNEMCAAAALFAGCEFFSGYPITPSTEIMQFLSREIWKYGGALLQAEDEIAGIGAAVGASFAGKKAMTATSGPGMSLKTEMLGLASIAELPLVVVNVQRGGPSTGMPTKSEQADLFQAVFSAHGDIVRPVLGPTSVADTFAVTVHAFNIAERFQTPVVILSDQEIAQRKESVEPIDVARFPRVERRAPSEAELQHYQRFRLTDDGVSPISHPGMVGGNYQGAGIEHNEAAAPTASGAMHARMTEKRFRKFDPLRERADLFRIEGDPQAALALISWGSTAGVCREAQVLAQAEGLRVKLLVPFLLYPVVEEVYRDFLVTVRAGLVVEQSHQAQLFRILRMFLDVPAAIEPFARSGANPFQPVEVVERLRDVALRLQRQRAESLQPSE
ncbi:MAG TPA: 2-oxoacid:acceptor oxidoreductase subunit alpha [Candidatus Kryptonia bacterium]|nr:2-oxoacid:acceptor oxidoreductase subunit alpha [Candidatus Kryptonia bacterium]